VIQSLRADQLRLQVRADRAADATESAVRLVWERLLDLIAKRPNYPAALSGAALILHALP
jgi:hypothetical protein